MRKNELTDKDMTVVREMASTRQQHDTPQAVLKDYSLQHRVKMTWDLSEESKRDLMFKLEIDDYEVILDWEEMQRYGRWI